MNEKYSDTEIFNYWTGQEAQAHGLSISLQKMVTPAARRKAVVHLRVAYEVSERRAYSTLGTDRTSMRYRSRRPDMVKALEDWEAAN